MVKIAIGITGASGAIYAQLLLDQLKLMSQVEVAVVMSKNAKQVWQYELDNENYTQYPFRFFDVNDFMAPFASGSSSYETLIICPCSMGTMGRIANGISDSLITRAADVMLKEKRKLILVARDMPYNLIHIRNMETITLAGGIICPASPSFYSKPQTTDEIAMTVVNRILRLCNLDIKDFRWGE